MWVLRVFSAVYLTAVCWAPDPQNDNTSASPLLTVRPTVYEPPIPSLQQQQPTWLDVFPSEKVVFICNITGSSDWTFTWSRDNKQIQSSDPNVLTSAGGSVLTITAAQIHSGSYTCKGLHTTKGVATADSNPLTLKVSANKPKPTLSRSSNFDKMFPGESITFTCKVEESSGWEYLWYHNDTEIKASLLSTYKIVSIDKTNSGYYYCKAKRGQAPFYTDKSETTILQVSDPPKPDLKLDTQWMDVFDNETVELMCEIPDPFINSDWEITWYKDHQKIETDNDLDVDPEEQLLNITSVSQAYQGGYTCEFREQSRGFNSGVSNTVNITVYDGIPKPKLRKDPDSDPMYFGETVNFTCSVDVSSGWEYKWYKDGNDLSETSQIISIQVGSLTTGNYMCAASRGDTTSTDNSEVIRQDALEIPVPSLKLITSWSDVFPDESVKLSCGLNRSSEWTYTWYKDGQQVQADNVVSFESRGATLSIQSASAAHAGQYKCMGNLKHRSVSSRFSSGLNLSVYDKKPTVTLMQDPDYDLMFPGESVSFRCHINISSGWEYLWYQGSNPLGISGNTYKINTTKTDQGLYKCQAKRGTDRVFITDFSKSIHLKVEANKPKPSMTRRPDVDKLYTGESVSFECKVAHSSGWEYFWYKNGTQLPINSNIFNISNTALLSTGVYSCMATRNKTMYKTEHSNGGIIHIYEIPKPSVKLQTQWLDVFPTESVKLSCGMDGSFDWTYTWYKHGEKVLTDNNLSFDSDATTLSISSASAFHSGQYTCLGKLKSRSVQSHLSSGLTLRVYGTKPRLILTQDPSHSVMHTSDSVSFSCHVNVSTGWEYLWYKDASLLAESGKNYTIASVLTKNTGSYKCQTKRGSNTVFLSDESQTVKLDIKERPKAEIVLLTGWSEVFSTDSLVLKCGVEESQDTWNYTWFKEDQPIDLVTSERHIVTPQNDPEQSLYTCQGIRSGRPSYSVISAHFKTKNLLLKRRVLLSISGCIVFGIVAVFFGCIFLKVFRKPAKDEYKPEEADLFLTMDQLKNRDDAPCPLVQYITNEELSASPNEGEENGTLCSETTPLPITPQEDQVTAENQEATASNGGLVSFKQ
uniref:titin isoform X2 n=1 Tax=Scatophagus argus TaxID=75038 RepID=UPI001ED8277C|nr:titin isoform X2 [Scatophagus argus]